ncbi:MAG: hypothetical protein JNG89_01810 [Planctomycetaceae bacterium]|nr:hypothetical protein [Planctomycetaceae bacterium]
MRIRLLIPMAAGCAVMVAARAAPAQQTVQQPVVEQFSADTVVSVPDRGRLYLGGVGSAGATRKAYGPIPSGSASGRFTSGSSLDVGVFIHDFEAMDELLLSRPTRRAPAKRFPSNRADAAWRRLHSLP